MAFKPVEGIKEVSNRIGDLAKSFSRDALGFDPSEVRDAFKTPYDVRLSHTPLANVIWETLKGVVSRGECLAKPNPDTEVGRKALEVLKAFGLEGIPYKDCFPIFDSVALETVSIDNMTNDMYGNYKQADTKLAEQWNKEKRDGKSDWKARDVQKYRSDNNLTWHESQDLKTCQLIPRAIHECFTHCGGRCEYSYRNNLQTQWENYGYNRPQDLE